MPYVLGIESKIYKNFKSCYFCDNRHTNQNCPLPYSSQTKIINLLQKISVEDNISFYNGGKGNKDLKLAFIWSKDFNFSF